MAENSLNTNEITPEKLKAKEVNNTLDEQKHQFFFHCPPVNTSSIADGIINNVNKVIIMMVTLIIVLHKSWILKTFLKAFQTFYAEVCNFDMLIIKNPAPAARPIFTEFPNITRTINF